MSSGRYLGPLGVAVASALWATDALFRLPASGRWEPSVIVAAEHLIAVLALLPVMLFRHRGRLIALTMPQWLTVAFLGVGASATATILFTESFRHVNPSVAILLQKLQPVFVVLLAVVALGERPVRGFYAWAALAVTAGAALNFPDPAAALADFTGQAGRLEGAAFALGAALIWAVATVAGKALLRTVHPELATFWRFAFGLAGLAAIVAATRAPVPIDDLTRPESLRALAYMALFPGLLAMLFYYQGLARSTASTATIVELVFPVSAVALNAALLDLPLAPAQLAAGAVLLGAVTRIALLSGSR